MAGKYDWNSMKQGLQKGVGEKSENKDYDDPREWKLSRDEQDNGTAVIRLLPGKGGDTAPIVRLYEHSIRMFHKKTNKYRYYIQPSPSTIGEACPVSELWYELGESGTDEAKAQQKLITRGTKFISNILVVNDPANPENNGKVFYFKYGVKLFEKFQSALEPTEAQLKVGKKGIELFDPMLGADIVLDVCKKDKFINYDGTSIEAKSAAFETEDEADECVMNKCYDLTEFISPDYFLDYEKLKEKLRWTLQDSTVEQFALMQGSNVITEAYKSKAQGAQSGAKQGAESATPGAGNYKAPAKAAKTTEVEPEQDYEDVPEKEPEKAPVKKAPTKAAVQSDDDIMALLDDI